MATCPSCNKFCSLDMEEPYVEHLEINDLDHDKESDTKEAEIDGSVRIVRTSSCCGDEIKEYTFDLNCGLTVKGHGSAECSLEVGEEGIYAVEEGGSRYAKSYYGFLLTARVTCACGKDVEIEGCDFDFDGDTITIEDKVAASEMEEI